MKFKPILFPNNLTINDMRHGLHHSSYSSCDISNLGHGLKQLVFEGDLRQDVLNSVQNLHILCTGLQILGSIRPYPFHASPRVLEKVMEMAEEICRRMELVVMGMEEVVTYRRMEEEVIEMEVEGTCRRMEVVVMEMEGVETYRLMEEGNYKRMGVVVIDDADGGGGNL
ncbi:uncharacterized protein G2W53_004577 [Senna tora]|uniref:Uncharacterized protein n=1 Tax=Senna tora TaxID=362788 RepID=A0A835CHD0_9FABA|nr:uncharacterized protein G2W53_004577 [Senna tora]